MNKIKSLIKTLQKRNSLKKIEKEKNNIIKKSEIKIDKILDPFINPPEYEDSLKSYENYLRKNLERKDFKGIFIYPKLKEKRIIYNKIENGRKRIFSIFMVFFCVLLSTLFLDIFDIFSLDEKIDKNEFLKFFFLLTKFYFFDKYISKKEKVMFFCNFDVFYLKNPIVKKLMKKVFYSFLEKKKTEIKNFDFEKKFTNFEIKKLLKIFFLVSNDNISDEKDFKIFSFIIFLLKKNNYKIDKQEKEHFFKVLSNSVFKDNFEFILLILKNFFKKFKLDFDYEKFSKKYIQNFNVKENTQKFNKLSKKFKNFIILENEKLKFYIK